LAFWKSVVVGKTLAIAAHRRINLIGRKRDELRLAKSRLIWHHYCPANVLDLASKFFCCMELGTKLACRDLNAYRS
jgi:hypothetical protein